MPNTAAGSPPQSINVTSAITDTSGDRNKEGAGIIGFLSRERITAGPGFNRWLIPPAALMVHLSIGEVYAFSVFKNPLVERFGVGLTPIRSSSASAS